MVKSFYTILAIGACIVINTLNAQPSIPAQQGRWIIDDADIISIGTESTIYGLINNEFNSTTNEIVIYTFPSLEGGDMNGYANQVFNTWHIGSKDKNNGILLIISFQDRKVRIEVGYGLEAYLTDIECSDITDNVIMPLLNRGTTDQAILLGVENIIKAINGTYKRTVNKNNFDYSYIWGAIMFVAFSAFFTYANFKRGKAKPGGPFYRGGGFGGFGGGGFSGGGGLSGGGGG